MLLKPTKVKSTIKTISDEQGNLVRCINNGKKVALSLKLVENPKSRKIGSIVISTKTLEVKRSREKHLFRKNSSYGFNHKLLKDAKLFDKVRLSDEYCEWLIPKTFILENGSFLHFKDNGGFERQIFIEIDKLNEFKKEFKV
jgi:hypothetical protein